jgi:hypothetical protein
MHGPWRPRTAFCRPEEIFWFDKAWPQKRAAALPACIRNLNDDTMIAEEIRRSVSELVDAGNHDVAVTVSIGVTPPGSSHEPVTDRRGRVVDACLARRRAPLKCHLGGQEDERDGWLVGRGVPFDQCCNPSGSTHRLDSMDLLS